MGLVVLNGVAEVAAVVGTGWYVGVQVAAVVGTGWYVVVQVALVYDT